MSRLWHTHGQWESRAVFSLSWIRNTIIELVSWFLRKTISIFFSGTSPISPKNHPVDAFDLVILGFHPLLWNLATHEAGSTLNKHFDRWQYHILGFGTVAKLPSPFPFFFGFSSTHAGARTLAWALERLQRSNCLPEEARRILLARCSDDINMLYFLLGKFGPRYP